MATTINDAASQFLASKRIAVTGVSRKPKDHGSNTVFQRLRDHGYEVFLSSHVPKTVRPETTRPNVQYRTRRHYA